MSDPTKKYTRDYTERLRKYAMDSEHDAFRRKILSDPHDQAPYLVYADWLEESDPRAAETYRKLATIPTVSTDDRYPVPGTGRVPKKAPHVRVESGGGSLEPVNTARWYRGVPYCYGCTDNGVDECLSEDEKADSEVAEGSGQCGCCRHQFREEGDPVPTTVVGLVGGRRVHETVLEPELNRDDVDRDKIHEAVFDMKKHVLGETTPPAVE